MTTVTRDLSIIIVNWNAGDLLRRCVAGIVAAAPAIGYEILVVDNASSDDSLDVLRRDGGAAALIRDGGLRIFENTENRGFGAANNQAFAHARTPFVLLLNPDAVLTSGAVESLVAVLRADPGVAACGPRILNADGSLQISVWRNPPAAWEIVLSSLRLYRVLPSRLRGELLLGPHWPHDRRRDVPMLSGAALMVRREAIDAVGGFDERFHMYGEDNEWSLRMVRAGWRLVFEPAAVVRHDEAQSARQRWTSLQKRRVQIEASYLLQRLSLPWWHVAANQLAYAGTAWMQWCWRRVRGADAEETAFTMRLHGRHLRQSLRAPSPSARRRRR